MKSLPVIPTANDDEPPLYVGDLEEDMERVSRNKLAETITGGLMYTSKMDVPSWSIPATRCRMGSILAKQEGSVCHPDMCYAKKGTFRFGNVQRKLERAYQGMMDPLWTPSMIQQIRWLCDERFRWFSSGDLQGINHLRNIIRICLETPHVMHWMPSREKDTILACKGEIPDNLVIRGSGTKVDGPSPKWWPTTSTVVLFNASCPSSAEGGSCSDHECVACWDPLVENVSYELH